jgi:tetratricopeptide (TPR) repeat protein
MKGDAQLDRQLEEFYNQGNYAEVTAFYEAHEGAFAEEKKVFKLVARAEVKLEQLAAEAGPAAEAPEEERAVAPPPDEPGVEVQVTEEAGRDDEASRSASPARRAGREDGRRSGPRPRIRRLVERGREALTLGDLDQAQRFLESCARRAPRFAACQRMLGVLYGHKQDHARSIRHYQRYLELAPDAQDARNIRNIIRNFEQTESRP